MRASRRLASGAVEWRCRQCLRCVLRHGPPVGDQVLVAGDDVPHVYGSLEQAIRETLDGAFQKLIDDMQHELLFGRPRAMAQLRGGSEQTPEQPAPVPDEDAALLAPWLRWMQAAGLSEPADDGGGPC
jgi:hypothetical protein